MSDAIPIGARLAARGGSSVGQSSGLIIRRSLVRVQPAPSSASVWAGDFQRGCLSIAGRGSFAVSPKSRLIAQVRADLGETHDRGVAGRTSLGPGRRSREEEARQAPLRAPARAWHAPANELKIWRTTWL